LDGVISGLGPADRGERLSIRVRIRAGVAHSNDSYGFHALTPELRHAASALRPVGEPCAEIAVQLLKPGVHRWGTIRRVVSVSAERLVGGHKARERGDALPKEGSGFRRVPRTFTHTGAIDALVPQTRSRSHTVQGERPFPLPF